MKEMCYWLPPFCIQNLLFAQPRWQPRTEANCIFITVRVKHKLNSWLHFDICLLRLAIFTRVLCKECSQYFFSVNSWLSFQRLCRLLWG